MPSKAPSLLQSTDLPPSPSPPPTQHNLTCAGQHQVGMEHQKANAVLCMAQLAFELLQIALQHADDTLSRRADGHSASGAHEDSAVKWLTTAPLSRLILQTQPFDCRLPIGETDSQEA